MSRVTVKQLERDSLKLASLSLLSKDAVKCAVKEEDRTLNLIIFGVKESGEDELRCQEILQHS